MLVGIGIAAWNRPDYFKQLLNSLELNDLSETEFHLFQDGAVCKFTGETLTTPEKINESIKAFSLARLPVKKYHIQEKNVSVAINQFEIMKFLSDHYRFFIFLEDDIIVSPHFVDLMKKLLIQFEKDKRVACISPGFQLLCKENQIKENFDKLVFKRGHFWAEACWRDKWRIVEKFYLPYYNIIKDKPYRKRNDQAIKSLFEGSGHKMLATSQDNGKDWAIMMSGMQRARFIVNRATGIGDEGIHSTVTKLKATGDGHNKIYNFEEELKINKFRL